MNLFDYVMVAACVLCVLLLLYSSVMLKRNRIVYEARRRAIALCRDDGDWSLYDRSGSYEQMLHDFRKWEFADFFPELAKRKEREANA